MARKQKPVKIKRYKNSMGTSTSSVYKIKQLIPVIGIVLALVLVGFLLGKPLLAMLSGAGDDSSSSQPDTSSQPVASQPVESQPVESQPVEFQPQPEPSEIPDNSENNVTVPPVIQKTKVYYYADVNLLATENGIDSVISQMQAKNATHLVFDLKNKDGNLLYASQNQYGSQLVADKTVDLSLLIAKLSAADITPVARIYTFMDKMISTVERSTAVMYQGTDTRWLDSSAALGGKAWANPASQIMQDYLLALTDEIMSQGVKEFIFAGFHTPTGYSLDKRDFGASVDQVLANMKNLLGTLEAKISAKGGWSALQVDYSEIQPEGNYAHYIVHPYQLGADNIVVTAKGADYDIGQLTVELPAAVQNNDVSSVALWVTDGVNTDTAQTMDSYFVS
ncbi:MAG: hypothetical protein IKK99_00945 [Oscillospiraceae bacterium]|nr:hypothetical protein [Oscillospiraceae bacterium]